MYYSNVDATKEVRRRLSDGRVIITDHAAERMLERGVSRPDICACLRRGIVFSSDFDGSHQDWVYRISLNISIHEKITAVVALPEESNDDIVVTVF